MFLCHFCPSECKEFVPNPAEKIEDCFFDNIISMEKSTRPKIFIHIENTSNILGLTQLCVESCMKYCSSTYDIILYTNHDIAKMIDEENDELLPTVNLIGSLMLPDTLVDEIVH